MEEKGAVIVVSALPSPHEMVEVTPEVIVERFVKLKSVLIDPDSAHLKKVDSPSYTVVKTPEPGPKMASGFRKTETEEVVVVLHPFKVVVRVSK